ncbi:MAG: pantetheine-phosphate adenylyltransferase [Actinomycetota bacterium]
MKTAIVPGSFDPITSGHLDIIKRAATLFDSVVVGVAKNVAKKPLFTTDERVGLVKKATSDIANVAVKEFDSLLVEFADRQDAHVIVKGLRAVSDFEHEFQMAQLNRELNETVETLFMMASPEYAYLSSSSVREIAEYGGAVKGLVPLVVEEALRNKFSS